DNLRDHALSDSAAWITTRRSRESFIFPHRIQKSLLALDALQNELDRKLGNTTSDSPTSLHELRENPRLLRSAIIESESLHRELPTLPRIGREPRITVLARAYLQAAHFIWNGSALRVYVEAAQEKDPLELQELWALPSVIKFELLESILHQARAMLHAPQSPEAAPPALLSTRIKSLRDLNNADWPSLMEPLVVFESILRQDPAHAYPRMDFDSREQYRRRIAEIARHSTCSETDVASMALDLARQAHPSDFADPRLYLRHAHVGYYIVDHGFQALSGRIGYRPRFIDRVRAFLRGNADDAYIGSIEVLSVLLIAAILVPLIPNHSIIGGLTFAFILLLLPATQAAVDFINNTITAIFKPSALPKLDFSKGIPADYATLVAVPTLLLNETQLHELI